MAIYKCKMCGGDLEVTEGANITECEYCGTKQTVPTADNEKKVNLFNRANRLRLNNEFDKAAAVYESIVAEFPEEAEAYWGLCLCNYGIEYVDDPVTSKKIPTCHRSSFDSLMDDSNFEMVMEYADAVSRKQYREEAKQIEEIRKGIIEVSSKEEPYDIFICYKETDDNGDRTVDSTIAQDVYDALTQKGYRVFFSRISLEDKLGIEYEPYIFAALNSAKIMLAFGTDYEYYNAVWVKNEWSRFLRLIASGQKKYLIPCYKSIDAYDMPKEFAKLQAQDMGKVGAIQDLVRGIDKLIGNAHEQTGSAQQTVVGGPNVTALLKRGRMAIEDGDFEDATGYFNEVLNMNAECAEAYLGLAMADTKLKSAKELIEKEKTGNKNYQRAKQFASESLLNSLNKLERQKVEEDKRIKAKLKAPIENAKKFQTIVAAGRYHTVGLKSDGTVVAVGGSSLGKCKVSGWTDIVAVSAGWNHTVGPKKDGTVVAVGDNDHGQCEVSGWTDIVAVSAGWNHTVGLKKDGTVVAAGDNDHGQCEVSGWADIVAVVAGFSHTVGLKKDGTVVATKYTGDYYAGQCEVSGWTDIVAVAAGAAHTVGLKSDGTVVATEYIGELEYHDRCEVSGWTDIVAVAAGYYHTVGLKKDGTVVAVGDNGHGQCGVSGWKLFDNSDNLENERVVKRAYREKGLCQHCGGMFNGLFKKKCSKCGKEKDY